jgi:hypothetical protein
MRASVSEALPAANGTTMVTGRVGQFCAWAVAAIRTAASPITVASTPRAAALNRFIIPHRFV